MLLFLPQEKPKTDIAIGESFQVTVTEEHWKAAELSREAVYRGLVCPIAQAIRERGMTGPVTHHHLYKYEDRIPHPTYTHDGSGVACAFDLDLPFPGPSVVTFTRIR